MTGPTVPEDNALQLSVNSWYGTEESPFQAGLNKIKTDMLLLDYVTKR